MPFGMIIQLSFEKIQSARAVVLALSNLLLILLFVRAVVIEQGLIPCNDQFYLCNSILFEKGTNLIVQLPRQSCIVLLCRLHSLRFITHLVIPTRATERRFFFLCHSTLSFRNRTDNCANAIHKKRPDNDDSYKQRFQQPLPDSQNSSHLAPPSLIHIHKLGKDFFLYEPL